MTTIVTNPFVLRQTPDSPFSHFDGEGGWDALMERIRSAYAAGAVRPGYRDGVCLVDIDVADILSGVAVLAEGAELIGSYKARVPGETPRKEVRAKGASKMDAVSAFAVLYRADVLAEGGNNTLAADSGGWEVISLNAAPVEGDMPIEPGVLMHNHFGSDGGTATGLSDSELVALLRKGFEFWKDKALAG